MSPPTASARVLPRDRILLAGQLLAIFLEIHLPLSQFLDAPSTIVLMGSCRLIRAATQYSEAKLYCIYPSFQNILFLAQSTNYRTINYAQIRLLFFVKI